MGEGGVTLAFPGYPSTSPVELSSSHNWVCRTIGMVSKIESVWAIEKNEYDLDLHGIPSSDTIPSYNIANIILITLQTLFLYFRKVQSSIL